MLQLDSFLTQRNRILFIPIAKWEVGECVNDGKHSTWEKEENLFRFKTECCSYKFEYRFDDCLGPATYSPTDDPTDSPSLSPIITPPPTDNVSFLFRLAIKLCSLSAFSLMRHSLTPEQSLLMSLVQHKL